MPGSLSQLHQRMIALCGTTAAGIGVQRSWLTSLLQREFGYINGVNPLPTPIATLSLQLSVVSASVKQGPGHDLLDCVLTLDIRPTADLTKSFRSWQLTANGVELLLAPDSTNRGELAFVAQKIPMPQQKPSSAHPDPALITQYYQGDEVEYLQDERAIILLGWKPLIQQFVQMIPFPRILQSQLTIRVLPPFTITYDTDYLIISSQNFGFFPPNCPASVGTNYSVRAEHKRVESRTQSCASFACEAKIEATAKSASAQCNDVLTDAAKLFLYLPRQVTLLKYVSDVLSPAIATNDSGTFALVRWYYNLSASLKQASLTLDFCKAPL